MNGRRRRHCAALLCVAVAQSPALAQEMEPRAYSASPVGANFLVASYSWSSGSVVFDPALPVDDVEAGVHGLVLAVGHSFNLFGRMALGSAALPYVHADVSGNVLEERTAITRSGLGDARMRLAVNLHGNPAMSPREFAASRRGVIVGASVNVTAPAGQYRKTALINLGANRWSFKPEVGVSIPKGRWDLDAYFGGWLYTANGDFFPGGASRVQSPVLTLQGHASYSLRPRLWMAVDATWYRGGSTRVEDGPPTTALNNSRIGATVSLPIGRRYSLKVAYGSGIVARTGTDFSTVAVAWQALWLSPRWSGRGRDAPAF